jgi:DNA-binding NarL/FixJ family response regulator
VGATKKNTRSKKRILIVDDHPMMRQGLAQLINSEPDLEVCAEADTAAQALHLVGTSKADLIIVDISLPDKNGLELIKDIRALFPELLILVVSMHDESLYAERVLRAGARGYLMKQEGGKKLMEAIRQILAGQIYVSEKMSATILEIFSGRRNHDGGSPMERLTDREFEVFQLVGEGRGTREIAAHLHLSVKTIEVHRANIKEKLRLKNATELVRCAMRWSESHGTS